MKALSALSPARPQACLINGPRLGPRQAQVVESVAQGLTDKQIATRMEISDETVATHLKRLFARFRVHSRLGLARQCLSLPPGEAVSPERGTGG